MPDHPIPDAAPPPAGIADASFQDRVNERWYAAPLPRKELRALMQRRDGPALANFGLWIVLLVASGSLGVLTWGTWWAVPAFFVYGTLYSSSDARWHECGHGTVFRTPWLNELFYQISSFMTLREAVLWRWSHTRHHTHTIITGADPEIQVTRPADLLKIVLDFFNLVSGPPELLRIGRHALGIISPDVASFVPASERRKMIWSSRAYVAIIGGFAVWSVAIGSFLPMMFIATPRFYAGWHHQLCGITQHAGLAENVRDHRLNTRTVYMNPVWRFLYMNMNYHIEHHMFPTVPYYALPALHQAVKPWMPAPYPSVLAAYREIVPALIRQSRDASYFVRRTVPAAA
ncbi:MAG: fatty acid desaturase [Acetobacteraceae bacterium]